MPNDESEYELEEPCIMPLRNGIDFSLEEKTEKLLAEDRREMRAMHVPLDYLTVDQMLLRRAREITGPYGAPDGALTHGMYKRRYNPNMGQRPTKLKNSDDS